MCIRLFNLIVALYIVALTVKCEILVLPASSSDDVFDVVHNIKPLRYNFDIDLGTNAHFNYFNATTDIEFVSSVNSYVLAFHFILADHIQMQDINLVNLNNSESLSGFMVTYHNHSSEPLVNLISNNQEFLRKNNHYKLMVKSTVHFIDEQRTGIFRFCDNSDNCFVTTNFETYFIRESLPSFDNATLKAHFNFKIRHRADMLAASNMPGKIISQHGDMAITSFEETPLMSTYLLTFIVGKFDRVEIENPSNISMSLFIQTGLNRSAEYLVNYAGTILHSLETYLNRSYPLPKLDFFASTTTTSSVRGMENWGLIGFDAKTALTVSDIKFVRGTEIALNDIAHEIGHQFFGNLVSVKDLKSTWLKEGLTTFFTHYMLNEVFPLENYMDRILTTHLIAAMTVENIQENFPLNGYSLENFGESYIVYSKGCAFTNMLRHVLGDTAFQFLIRSLINKYAYDSITTADFIHEIRLVNQVYETIQYYVDIPEFVNSWINQNKFPLVTISRNYTSNLLEISQMPWDRHSRNQSEQWWIPFNYATKSNPNFNKTSTNGWLLAKHASMFLNLEADDWIIFNKHGAYYYIVNYDYQNWNLITNVLESASDRNIIPTIDRAKILYDVILLHNAQLVSSDILNRIINSLQYEYSYGVWRVFRKTKRFLADIRHHKYPIKNLYNFYGLVDRENDTREDQMAREIAYSLACESHYKKCIADMNNVTLDIKTKLESGEPFTINRKLFATAFQYGIHDDEQFRALFNLVNQTNHPLLQAIFSRTLPNHANKTTFLQYYVSSVYQLPLTNENDRILRNNIFYKDEYNQIEMIYKCIERKCFDFEMMYPSVVERQKVIYDIVELTLKNIDEQKFLNESKYNLHDLLQLIDSKFGDDISARIRSKYDVNYKKYNTG